MSPQLSLRPYPDSFSFFLARSPIMATQLSDRKVCNSQGLFYIQAECLSWKAVILTSSLCASQALFQGLLWIHSLITHSSPRR